MTRYSDRKKKMTESRKIRLGSPFSKLTATWSDAKKNGNRTMVVGGAVFIFARVFLAVAGIFMLFIMVGIVVNGAGAERIVTGIEVRTSTSS